MKKVPLFLFLGVYFLLCNNCRHGKDSETLFVLHTPEATGVQFSNILFETTQLNIITFEYFYNGAGVAVGDINGDGLQDIYFSGNMVEGKLYLNKGNFKFEDITAKAGISTKNQWGTGVSMADVNGDGRLDLLLCFAGPYAPETRQKKLYLNKGDLTFQEVAQPYGFTDHDHTTQAAWLDYDRDGDLDVYFLNNITDALGPNVIRPKRNNGEMANTDRLYRNDGGHFTDVSRAAGIVHEGYGLGIAIGDINQDGWPDIYVSNDYISNDVWYFNNQDGTFTDHAAECLRHSSYNSMGCDLADYNNDGLLDLVALDMLPPDHYRRKMMTGSVNYNRFRSEVLSGYFPQYMRNTLQINQGQSPDNLPIFSEIGQLAGVDATDWSWSPLLQDLDNDGLKDLIITNGYPRDITNLDFASYRASPSAGASAGATQVQEMVQKLKNLEGAYLPNFVFQNQGNLQFKDQSAAWGFTQKSFSHGAALADLDNDGDLDYVTNNAYDKAFIYENKAQQQQKNHYLRLQLQGPGTNTQGVGAKIWLYQEASVQYQEFYPVRGYQSTIEPLVHFGLGKNDQVDSLRIQWPDGSVQVLRQVAADQLLKVAYTADKLASTLKLPATALFEPISAEKSAFFVHQDPHYNDFAVQPLLPNKQSQDGPSLCVADVNGDGLDDFFIGGAFQQSGQVFMQQKDGRFSGKPIDVGASLEEDLGSLFFDADGDGDQDLYVCSGSNEFPVNAAYYQDRLYSNDGHGNFNLNTAALPELHTSKSCVTAADFDRDGDLDLFVGGRCTPGRYPEAPPSYLLENQQGRFVDVTAQKAPELARIGMVTDAQWADLDADGWEDLVVLGEWMPICFFKNQAGILKNQSDESGLEQSTGWWNRLVMHDLDRDGDLDMVAGNWGFNSVYRTNATQPISLFFGDFDGNGQPDPVVVSYLQNHRAPMAFRNDLLGWIAPLKKQFTDYAAYAKADWPDFFPGKPTQEIAAQTFATCWIENTGNGQFILHPLPIEAQMAPVFGILADDFNADGFPDLLLTGNTSAPNSNAGQIDALNGLLLTGSAKHTFLPKTIRESGFYVPGEGRDLAKVKTARQEMLILAGRNNGGLLCFRRGG
jgi:hypothetical protein